MYEKRQHPRTPVTLPLVVIGPDGARTEGSCRDMSLGGMFLETTATFPFGTAITLALTLPNLGATEIPAIVRWTEQGGFGVQFGLLGARQTHELSALINPSR